MFGWEICSRGNKHSRSHKAWNPYSPLKQNPFWEFSLHEVNIYDLPAMIDHILEET